MRKSFLLSVLICLLTIPVFGDYHVSPQGNDANDGSSEKPFKTIQKALDTISQKKIAEKDRTVYLADGFYYLDSTIRITANHNGLNLTAEKGARPILCGGKPLTQWKKEGKFLTADVPNGDFRYLAINGSFAERTRLPEEGKYKHNSVFKSHWMSSSLGGWDVKPTDEQLTSMKYRPEDLDPITDLENCEITLYHMWDETLLQVAANDKEKDLITFSTKPAHPAGAFNVDTYVVWNTKHGMKRPGQWYLDRKAKKVVYWPKEGENESNIRSIAPSLSILIMIQNAERITLSQLGLTGTNTPLIAGGFGAGHFSGALEIGNSKEIKLDRIAVSNVSGQGIKASNIHGMILSNSHIRQTGAKGISLHGQNIRVENNSIHDVGLIYPSAIALTCHVAAPRRTDKGKLDPNPVYGTSEKDAKIHLLHNEVYNGPYCGISCAGGSNVLIESNRVHNVMRELGDGAAIYCGGGKHYTYRGNFVYDLFVFQGFGASSYYYDEQADYCVIEKNLSFGPRRPIHCHMTHNTVVKDNVFIIDEKEDQGILSFARDTDAQLVRNILIGGKSGLLRATGIDPTLEDLNGRFIGMSEVKNNIFFNQDKKMIYKKYWKDVKNRVKTVSLETTVDADHPAEGLILLDPEIKSDPKNGKIEFKNPEKLKEFGIRELDVSSAGLIGPVPKIDF
ncbi:MAG: right-handed parallel beta-helix repeat-containing protein [Planctomycetia bacterium]|nr:right-handed parallel beta-helix repeat-containing protein [Planctomycetia bacterium]